MTLCAIKSKSILWLLIYVSMPWMSFPPSGDPWLEEKGWTAGGRDHAAEETDQPASELTSHSSHLWAGQSLTL